MKSFLAILTCCVCLSALPTPPIVDDVRNLLRPWRADGPATASWQNAESTGERDPVILVPSLIGSRFNFTVHDRHEPLSHFFCPKNEPSETLWISPELGTAHPFHSLCIMEALGLSYDSETDTLHSPDGISVDTHIDFGGIGGCDYLLPPGTPGRKNATLFGLLADYLVEAGYSVRQDLFGAPYDWRLGPTQWVCDDFLRLKGLFELSFDLNQRPATAISLSMGGPYFTAFCQSVSEEWKAKYIKAFISFSGSFGGAPLTFEQVNTLQFYKGGKQSKALRDMTRGFPASAFLLPSPSVYGDDVLVSTLSANFTAADLLSLLDDEKVVLADIRHHQIDAGMGDWVSAAPNVTSHIFYGFNMSTPYTFYFEDSFETLMDVGMSDGDGTCPLRGLVVPATWEQDTEVKMYPFPNMEHADFIRGLNPEIFPLVLEILSQ